MCKEQDTSNKTYLLLVEHLGESVSYKLCERLGGVVIAVPKKAHKTYRIRQLFIKAKGFDLDSRQKTKLVQKIAKLQGVSTEIVYKIIRDLESEK